MTSAKRGASVQGAVPEELDGRRRRSAQSREAIAKAMFDLVGEGDLRPSAQRIADRAGVGIRTVFRHFDEMDRLYVEMHARLRDSLQPFFARGRPEGPLRERAQKLAAVRCEIYEHLAPYQRAANLNRQNSDYLGREHRETVRALRTDLERWIPELTSASAPIAGAMEVAVSFQAWDRLRSDQGLSQRATREAMEHLVDGLLGRLSVKPK